MAGFEGNSVGWEGDWGIGGGESGCFSKGYVEDDEEDEEAAGGVVDMVSEGPTAEEYDGGSSSDEGVFVMMTMVEERERVRVLSISIRVQTLQLRFEFNPERSELTAVVVAQSLQFRLWLCSSQTPNQTPHVTHTSPVSPIKKSTSI